MTSQVMAAAQRRPYDRPMPTAQAGPLLREWRTRRRLSQLDLSSRTGVSTRHLSCVETGRSKPSRDLLVYLADELDMPRRATNDLLLAAGFAPVFSHLDLGADELTAARTAMRLVLDGNDRRPTTVIDTRWNLVDANAAAFWLAGGVDDELLVPPINVARLTLHPLGMAGRIENLDEFAPHLLRVMRRTHATTGDPELVGLIDECSAYVGRADHRSTSAGDGVVLPMRVRVGGDLLTFMSTVTTFGAAHDVTLAELSIETLYPADDQTRSVLDTEPWSHDAPSTS